MNVTPNAVDILAFALLQVMDADETDWSKELAESGSWPAWTVLDDTPIKGVVAD
jgi:hypothetical protein